MMNGHFLQTAGLLGIETPLGPDKLLLRSFDGREAISELFHYRLDLLSEDRAIDFDKVIGQNVTFWVRQANQAKPRYFNGRVSRFARLPHEDRLAHYEADVEPWLWLLGRSADCRIFQNGTVPEIVEEVFKEHGFFDYELHFQAPHQPWEYCVQYRETALNFAMRLLEQEGIFFFFRHEKGKHTLVLADTPAVHRGCPEQARVRCRGAGGRGEKREEDRVFLWEVSQELRSGRWALSDYNFETPAALLATGVKSRINQGGNQRFEQFEYPGDYRTHTEGDAAVKLRMEEEETGHTIVTGESDCRSFASGFKFELYDYEQSDQNGEYTLTTVTHHAEEGGFYSGSGSVTEALYRNSFAAVPSATVFRPARRTPRPVVHGSQTAVVAGPAGEEIYTDKYGRVKVQFHWDRRGRLNENSSCWIRVAQAWAGKGWGAMAIPRIGQEVIVDFLEGDPNRPIITGRVYNAVETPPYALPGEQTRSGIKSLSSKGGGGFNEVRFEDRKGSEQVFVHGEKDLDVRIKNDRREWIGHDRHLQVRRDRLAQVERDEHLRVGRDRVQELGRDEHLHVKGKQAVQVDGSRSLIVRGNSAERYTADAFTEAGHAIHLKSGKLIVVESGLELTLKAPGGFITIGPDGVTIYGSKVRINSGGAAALGPGGNPVPPMAPLAAQPADSALPGGLDGGAAPPSHNPAAPQNQAKTHWIEIRLEDERGAPVAGQRYRVTLPDGSVADGTLDENGLARIEHIDAGTCKVTFPDLDRDAWKAK